MKKFKKIQMEKLSIVEVFEINHKFQLEKMEKEIDTNDLIQPLSVVGPYSDGTYKIIDGARRYHAMTKLCKGDKIPCYIYSDKKLKDLELRSLVRSANAVKRDDVISSNLLFVLATLFEFGGEKTKKEITDYIAKEKGFSERHARDYVNIVTFACDELLHSLMSGKSKLTDVKHIVKSYKNDKNMQIIAMNKCIEAENRHAVKKDLLNKIIKGEDLSNFKISKEKSISSLRAKDAILSLKYFSENKKGFTNLSDSEKNELKELCQKILAM